MAFSKKLRLSFEADLGFEVCDDEQAGVEAISKATNLNPDLVILEIESSPGNSFQVAEAIKLILPKIPLFLVTNHPGVQAEKEALTRGVDAVFEKEDYASLLLNARAAVLDLMAFLVYKVSSFQPPGGKLGTRKENDVART
jgi:DNA-binding NarL/FixJ family response regulator